MQCAEGVGGRLANYQEWGYYYSDPSKQSWHFNLKELQEDYRDIEMNSITTEGIESRKLQE